MTEFMKSDNSELEDVFNADELKDLKSDSQRDLESDVQSDDLDQPEAAPMKPTKVEPEPEQEEVVVPLVEPSKAKPTSLPVEDDDDSGTLSDYLRKKEFLESEEGKAAKADAERLEASLKDLETLDDIMKMATLTGESLNHLTILDLGKKAKPAPTHFKRNNPTYQVALNQSAYIAHMEGLTFPDVFNINSTISNDYEITLKKYKTYFDKISHTSIGINTFEEFSRMTSLFDVDTLAFGILNQTFPGKIKYDITCKNCHKVMNDVGIPNDKLIVVKDDEVYGQVSKIINSIDNPEKADVNSLVNKITRIQLKDSKTILDIRVPTIEDHLDILAEIRKTVSEEELQRSSNFLLFVKAAYVLDTKETLLQKKPIFVEYRDRKSILDILRNMSIRDAGQANEFIEGREEKYRISYAIQSFPCRHCGEEVGDVSVDIDDLLFLESVQHFIK